ncbi:hypothetical protein [Nocardia anaemiae]|uniref:hypothetical protein n=1 Tax=Nocardia anaemiae TaxID=263910 RepID=UPI0007A4ABF8|nr:hypothetical protein [Nocardia anaemiae]
MRALLSVTDKRGIVTLASNLAAMGWELLATDGTASALADCGIEATRITDWTGTKPLFDGRVKTLHHHVFAALLCRQDSPTDATEAAAHGVVPFDLIAGNFHTFNPRLADPVDSIDIGGPAMIRAAAKNHRWVIPLVDTADYPRIVELLRADCGSPSAISQSLRRELAGKAFRVLGVLDSQISDALIASDAG